MEIKQLSFGFDPYTTLFENLDLTINEPGIYGLLGRNSIGKTTLFNLISKHLNNTFDFGIQINEVSYISNTDVFLTYKLNHLIQLLEGPYFNKSKCLTLIKQFNIPIKKRIGTLSKGIQSLITIILTVCIEAKYYLLDEPYNFLDMYNKDQINRLFYELQEESKFVIISSHHIMELENLLSHVIILEHKRIVYQSSMEQLDYLQISEQNENVLATFNQLGKIKYLKHSLVPCYQVDLTMLFTALTLPTKDDSHATQ